MTSQIVSIDQFTANFNLSLTLKSSSVILKLFIPNGKATLKGKVKVVDSEILNPY